MPVSEGLLNTSPQKIVDLTSLISVVVLDDEERIYIYDSPSPPEQSRETTSANFSNRQAAWLEELDVLVVWAG